MNQIEELKNLLRELAKQGKNSELLESWIEILKQNYIINFPNICINSLKRELTVYDYAEYILNKEERIEDRYSCYYKLNSQITFNKFSDYDEAINIHKKLYRSLLIESIEDIGYLDCIQGGEKNERLYIYINLYFPNSKHAPSIILEKIHKSLRKYFKTIIVVVTPTYHFPYPIELQKEQYFNNRLEVEDNHIYNTNDITFIKFGGYLTESLYLEFVNHQNFTVSDKFISIGHSNIHFDLIKSNNKISIPTTISVFGFNNSLFCVSADKDIKIKNIFNKKQKIILSNTDFTRDTKGEEKQKSKKTIDDILNIAIVGNRLEFDLDKKFFEFLDKSVKILPNIRYKIIGILDGKVFDSIIPKGLLDNIEFIGHINNLEEYFIENIDFYLNPKRQGGGQSSMISLKSNIPVITLAYGDVYFALENKYNINSFDEITDFIEQYITNKDFRLKIDSMNEEIISNSQNLFESMIKEIIDI